MRFTLVHLNQYRFILYTILWTIGNQSVITLAHLQEIGASEKRPKRSAIRNKRNKPAHYQTCESIKHVFKYNISVNELHQVYKLNQTQAHLIERDIWWIIVRCYVLIIPIYFPFFLRFFKWFQKYFFRMMLITVYMTSLIVIAFVIGHVSLF